METLAALKDEYSEWFENMPDSLQQGPTGEKLQGIIDTVLYAMEDIDAAVSDVETQLDEAEGVDLPRGYGKD